jgi:hypothetical protein
MGKKRKRNKQSKVDQKTSSESEVAKAMETGAEMKSVKKRPDNGAFSNSSKDGRKGNE